MLKLSHVKKTFNKGTVTEKRALTGVDNPIFNQTFWLRTKETAMKRPLPVLP